MDLRKTFFILPNLFTLSGVFCGFFAIITVAAGGEQASSTQLYQAAIAVICGVFFDMADGRVARLTKTQSSLGLQLDSLADVISFGVAPALMMYRWGLSRLTTHMPYVGPYIGAIVAFVWLACAALRLARFNVLALAETSDNKKPGKYILGLPVPAAASVLLSLVLVNYQLALGDYGLVGDGVLAVVVTVLSALMVSRVRFRSFKDLRPSRRTIMMAFAIVGTLLALYFVKHVQSGLLFLTMMGSYLALGLFEEVVFFQRRRLEARTAANSAIGVEAEGGARSDEEVLAALGAYDDIGAGEPEPSSSTPPVARITTGAAATDEAAAGGATAAARRRGPTR